MAQRRTITRDVTAAGTALHAGVPVTMTLKPAPDGAGILFRRAGRNSAQVEARYDLVTETRLGTVIANSDGVKVGVVEHLLAAIAGAEIDDLIVELDGPEPPILDGDALSYLMLLENAGVQEQHSARTVLQILRPVEVSAGDARASLSPSNERDFILEIAFASAAIGQQRFEWRFSRESFREQIAPARTFGFIQEFDQLRAAGLAGGASLENTLALDGDRVLNGDLMRFPDEFVRHKILDALGDLALAGAPILGRFEGVRSGHALNNALLRQLFSDSANYRWITVP